MAVVLGIVQARLGSSRLPGKVLSPVDVAVGGGGGAVHSVPLLELLMARLRASKLVDQWILATSTRYVDDELAAWASAREFPCFRGSEDDVLDRFYQASLLALNPVSRPEALVVRVTADCPLLDGAEVDRVVAALQSHRTADPSVHFLYNGSLLADASDRTTPDGIDVEAFSFAQLDRAWRSTRDRYDREHVTPFLRRQPGQALVLHSEMGLGKARWTVDTADDLEFVRQVVSGLTAAREASSLPQAMGFSIGDVAQYIAAHPALQEINSGRGGAGVGSEVDVEHGQALYARARAVIPGGTQLLSKRPEMFLPERWPCYYRKAAGFSVTDLDGHRFSDASYNAIGACVLGMGDPDVDAAVHRAVESGSMATLNCPDEVYLAEKLVALHADWAGKVRFARSGGEAMAMAVRIARAHTKRDVVAVCGYHGWHDWYLAGNLGSGSALDGHLLPGLDPAGVPRGLAGTMVTFRYNDTPALERILAEHGPQGSNRLAAVVMEPIRSTQPEPEFLAAARRVASAANAVLVFDEITVGFRLTLGGAHKTIVAPDGSYVKPDIAVFGKGMSNGFAMAAVVGSAEVMESAQETFISSTYWTESVGPAAALACISKFERLRVHEHLATIGALVCDSWTRAAATASLPLYVERANLALPHFEWRWPTLAEGSVLEAPPAMIGRALKTLFTQKMLLRGYLATPSFYITYAHTPAMVSQYEAAVTEVFRDLASVVARALAVRKADGNDDAAIEAVLSVVSTPLCHAGFARLSN